MERAVGCGRLSPGLYKVGISGHWEGISTYTAEVYFAVKEGVIGTKYRK